MRILTRLALLIIIFTVSVALGYGQESKTKQGSKVAVEPPSPPAAEYNPNSWKEFSDERGMFSIMFPGTPLEADNGSSEVTGRKFTLKTSAVYFVAYQDFSASFQIDLEKDAALRKQFWDASRDVVVSQTKAKVLNEADISIDGHPGIIMKLAFPDGTILREKRYVVGKRIYQMYVVTPKELLVPDAGRLAETRATKFLDSFRLAGPKKNEEGKP